MANNITKIKGAMTLELLLAFAIFTLNITAVILVINGSQSVSIDTETSTEALAKANTALEEIRVNSLENFSSTKNTESTETSGSLVFTKNIYIADQTHCRKLATSKVSWTTPPARPQKVELQALLLDKRENIALGGDCPNDVSLKNWDSVQTFASDVLPVGQPTTLDVLDKIAYIGTDQAPFFQIINTEIITEGQTMGLLTPFNNSFDLGAEPNHVDVVKLTDPTGVEKTYAFFAMNTLNKQLKVVDVTDINSPTLVASKSLSTCVTGSAPQGWRLFVYQNKLYLATRFTAGPEFHIFDISNPINPAEIGNGICNGYELGSTVERIAIEEQKISASKYVFAYLATDQDSRELRVLDATNPSSINEVPTASQDLPGIQDGESLYISGSKLYFGRRSTPPGPDLYVFDITDPLAGLPTMGSADIGTSVLGIKIVGPLAFLATTRAGKQIQVWNVVDPSNMYVLEEFNSGYIVGNGFDYSNDFIYTTLQSSPNLKILYDNTP